MKPPAPPRPGVLARLLRRAKLLVALAAAFALIFAALVAFVVGFALGYSMSESEARARCEGAEGTWSAELGLCTEKAPATALPASWGYSCGDGRTANLEFSADLREASVIFSDGARADGLPRVSPPREVADAPLPLERYELDGGAELALAGDELEYRASAGEAVSCVRR